MNKEYIDILVCPVSKDKLIYNPETSELICKTSKLAYPIKDGIPIMLENQARSVSKKELK